MGMMQVAEDRLTFEEFLMLPQEDTRYELVDGQRFPLMAPDMVHGTVQVDLAYYLRSCLGDDFGGYLGVEVDIPTVPFHGRRPDLVYLTPEHVTNEDYVRGYPLHPPDLVVEIVSEGQERRDYVEKRLEYARAGIRRYWILDPAVQSIEMLILGENGDYRVEFSLGAEDTLVSSLFPGLQVSLQRLFPRRHIRP